MEKFNRIKFKRINYVKLVRTLLGPSVAPRFYSAAIRGGGQEEEEEVDRRRRLRKRRRRRRRRWRSKPATCWRE